MLREDVKLPYPLEELRRFILAEYPSLNDMNRPHYKTGALISAVLRWWTDEHLPAIQKMQDTNKFLESQNADLVEKCINLRNRVWKAEARVKNCEATLAEIKRLADVLIGPHGEEHYLAERAVANIVGINGDGLISAVGDYERTDMGDPEYPHKQMLFGPTLLKYSDVGVYCGRKSMFAQIHITTPPEQKDEFMKYPVFPRKESIVGKAEFIMARGLGEAAARSPPEYNQEEPIWISEMILILGASRFLDLMRRYPGMKINVWEKDLNHIVEVYPETVKIPYWNDRPHNCRCVPSISG